MEVYSSQGTPRLQDNRWCCVLPCLIVMPYVQLQREKKRINQTLKDLHNSYFTLKGLKGNRIPYDQMQQQVYHLQRGKLWKQ